MSVLANLSKLDAKLQKKITRTADTIPLLHHIRPGPNEKFLTRELALSRLNNWAFLEGYGYTSRSTEATSARYVCQYHQQSTRNTRNLNESSRQRLNTQVTTRGCPSRATLRFLKRTQDWHFSTIVYEHNHIPDSNPFNLRPHKARDNAITKAKEIASAHRGVISYSESQKILAKHGLSLQKWDFYNLNWRELQQREEIGSITAEEELLYTYQTLELSGFHVEVREEFLWDGIADKPHQRIVRDLFFIHPEQIRHAQRFVADFVYQVDTTWDISRLKLPLCNYVGINNLNHTFPVGQLLTTSESAAAATFGSQMLDRYIFFHCRDAWVVMADFGAGLGKAMGIRAKEQLKALEDSESSALSNNLPSFVDRVEIGKGVTIGETDTIEVDIGNREAENNGEESGDESGEGDTIVVHHPLDSNFKVPYSAIVTGPQIFILQLCSWHAVKAMRTRLIKGKGFSKEKIEKLSSMLWAWVTATSEKDATEAYNTLLKELSNSDGDYVKRYYYSKRKQFVKAWTQYLPNLGCYSTQRNESYNGVAKTGLDAHMRLRAAVRVICSNVISHFTKYDSELLGERTSDRRLDDPVAFKRCKGVLTHACLQIARKPWAAARELSNLIDKEGLAFDFDPEKGCTQHCSEPIQYGIPCKHWMVYCLRAEAPLPPQIFHPRWLYQWNDLGKTSWKMTCTPADLACFSDPTLSLQFDSLQTSFDNPVDNLIDNPFDNLFFDDFIPADRLAPVQDIPNVLQSSSHRHENDRFLDRGIGMVLEATNSALDMLKALPPQFVAEFAEELASSIQSITTKQDFVTQESINMPSLPPQPPAQPNLYRNKNGKVLLADQRAIELAENQRRVNRQKQIEYNNGQKVVREIREARQKELDAQTQAQKDIDLQRKQQLQQQSSWTRRERSVIVRKLDKSNTRGDLKREREAAILEIRKLRGQQLPLLSREKTREVLLDNYLDGRQEQKDRLPYYNVSSLNAEFRRWRRINQMSPSYSYYEVHSKAWKPTIALPFPPGLDRLPLSTTKMAEATAARDVKKIHFKDIPAGNRGLWLSKETNEIFREFQWDLGYNDEDGNPHNLGKLHAGDMFYWPDKLLIPGISPYSIEPSENPNGNPDYLRAQHEEGNIDEDELKYGIDNWFESLDRETEDEEDYVVPEYDSGHFLSPLRPSTPVDSEETISSHPLSSQQSTSLAIRANPYQSPPIISPTTSLAMAAPLMATSPIVARHIQRKRKDWAGIIQPSEKPARKKTATTKAKELEQEQQSKQKQKKFKTPLVPRLSDFSPCSSQQ